MGHFARLDKNNVVTQVIRVSNDIITSEQAGIDFCKNLYQTDDDFVQTSYNTEMGEHLLGGTPLRKNFAGIGSIYDASRDAFYIQKPYESFPRAKFGLEVSERLAQTVLSIPMHPYLGEEAQQIISNTIIEVVKSSGSN